MDNVKAFVKEHFILLLTIVVFLIAWFIGGLIRGSARKEYMAAYNQVSDLKNQIEHDTITLMQDKTTVAVGLLEGLDKQRWQEDDIVINEWIYPAFNFDNADEYNANRDIFIDRLGMNDDFVIEVMPPYDSKYALQSSEDMMVDDGTGINMHVTNFVSYVDAINDDVYSYVAVVTVSSTNKKGKTMTSDIILTYSIDGSGSVQDFHAATTYDTV